MIVRHLDGVTTVDWGNGLGHQVPPRSDRLGYTVTDTTVRAGTQSSLEYRNHLEACYRRGQGRGHRARRHLAPHRARHASARSTSTTPTCWRPPRPGPPAGVRVQITLRGDDERHDLDSPEFSHY